MSERNTLYDVVRNSGFDFHDEYETLRAMVDHPIRGQFEELDVDTIYADYQPGIDDDFGSHSLSQLWKASFLKFPTEFRGTSRSVEDFNRRYLPKLNNPNLEPECLDEFILYCEYVMTFTMQLKAALRTRLGVIPIRVEEHVGLVLKNAGYMGRRMGQWFLAVKEDEQLCSAAEQVPLTLGTLIFKYRHSRSQGKLDFKREVLSSMYKHLEPYRKEIRQLCSGLENVFFKACNNFNIRHNNVVEQTPKYQEKIAALNSSEIEAYYDKLFTVGILLINAFGLKEDLDEVSSLQD